MRNLLAAEKVQNLELFVHSVRILSVGQISPGTDKRLCKVRYTFELDPYGVAESHVDGTRLDGVRIVLVNSYMSTARNNSESQLVDPRLVLENNKVNNGIRPLGPWS